MPPPSCSRWRQSQTRTPRTGAEESSTPLAFRWKRIKGRSQCGSLRCRWGLGIKGSQACVKCNVFVSLLFMHMLPWGGGTPHFYGYVLACVCVHVRMRACVYPSFGGQRSNLGFVLFFLLKKSVLGRGSGGTSVECFHFPPWFVGIKLRL